MITILEKIRAPSRNVFYKGLEGELVCVSRSPTRRAELEALAPFLSHSGDSLYEILQLEGASFLLGDLLMRGIVRQTELLPIVRVGEHVADACTNEMVLCPGMREV